MIKELWRRMLEKGMLTELSIDELRNIDLGTKVITLETRTGMELGDTIFILDELTIGLEMLQRILSYHASTNPPAVRFFELPELE
ncbi:MAG: hypothetical protein OEX81_00795 [Candidatus Pacebacteria bacterium]|nr:hypothetical protein [Candidatus Paceibacterota bacterium]